MENTNIQTPYYLCEERKLRKNLEILKYIQDQSGAKILLALKGFAFKYYGSLVSEYLYGCCASGLYEAKLARECFDAEVHTYSPAFKDCEFDEIISISDHIVFNSYAQYSKYISKCNDKSVALRINPNISCAPTELYNPCGKYSRFGIKKNDLGVLIKNSGQSIDEFFAHIDGLHFHALCEQGAQELQSVLEVVERDFGKYFKYISYINLGGGHHITKDGYNTKLLIELILDLKSKYNLEVYLEPGEAVGWQSGDLHAGVVDIVRNDIDIAVLDTSAEAHMSDTLAMPYRADVVGAKKQDEYKYNYMLAGNTCLAGDVMGIYSFKSPLKIGDKVVFQDMIHYTIVKNTTFNGIKLPSLAIKDMNNNIKVIKEFGYEEYFHRN